MAAQFNVLAVAVSTGRVAYVYLTNGVPDKWGMSRTASKTTQKAAQIIQSWIDDLQPDLLISERVETASRKGSRVKDVLEVIEDLFENADGLNMRLTRHQSYQNKYEEAKALANAYPALKHLRHNSHLCGCQSHAI